MEYIHFVEAVDPVWSSEGSLASHYGIEIRVWRRQVHSLRGPALPPIFQDLLSVIIDKQYAPSEKLQVE